MGFVYVEAVTKVRKPVNKNERYNIVNEISDFALTFQRRNRDGRTSDN